ncbi:MAG: NADH-quinone oxidoreductase subunit J [Anaerolineales bacterium]|nr:NADH-quinone oxidoreductase subunit J [Anaerolineales bacterium]
MIEASLTDFILFFGLALVAVASALGMLFSKNAIYSALNLILNFVTVAIFYLLLGAPFIALSQVGVYAGAIMVLFLFVIMLLGAEKLGSASTLAWQRPLALALGVILIIEAGYILIFRPGALPAASAAPSDFGSATSIGNTLFNNYLLPFEVISVLLLVAMVGAIVLSKKKKPV